MYCWFAAYLRNSQQSNQRLLFPQSTALLSWLCTLLHLLQEIRSACWPCSCSALHAAACFRRASDCARWSGLHSPECVAPHTLWESRSVGVAEMGLWWMAAPLHQELLLAPGYPEEREKETTALYYRRWIKTSAWEIIHTHSHGYPTHCHHNIAVFYYLLCQEEHALLLWTVTLFS